MKIAIILSGCGNRDGSELQETLSIMLAIDRRGWEYNFFAPQGEIKVVDHLQGKESGEKREILTESARIARGAIKPISEFNAKQYDAIVLPGGMGAARNLSNYAFVGEEMEVRPEIAEALLDMYRLHKPIMAMCIAPMILAKVLGTYNVKITLGQECEAATVAQKLGAKHQICAPTEVCIDTEHKVLTTPAYMVGNRISQIFDGAENMVAALSQII